MDTNTLVVTNPIQYSISDLDSDSDSDLEQCQSFFRPNLFRPVSEIQEYNLVKLGCSNNLLDDYKKSFFNSKPKSVDQQYDVRFQNHLSKIQKEKDLIIEEQKRKKQEELKKYKALLSEIKSLAVIDDATEDKAFEEQLKKEKKLIDDAIALDKKRSEEQTAEAKAKAEKEKKEAEEKERKKKELKEKNEKMLKLQQSSATSLDGLEEYKKYYKKIEHYKSTIKPKLSDPVFRKQCFEARKIIKRTVAQLQASHQVILEKYNTIYAHLMGVKQQSADAFEVMLNFLAKVFLLQVKQEIHATPHAAYFLARFAYLVCSTIPEFSDYLMGRLMKRCPYLIPQYHDDDPNLTQDEIKARLRYSVANKEKKTLETFLQHAEAQKCYIMFYGALAQTLPDAGQPENPFPIKHAWIYLARICNMPPREITPFLIMGLLEVSAKRLMEAYPRQTPKVLRLLRETIIPLFPSNDATGNVSVIKRLEMFLDDYFSTGVLNCVTETLPSKV